MSVKYPNVTVKLVGTDGNAFVLMGRVSAAMKKAKIPKEEIDAVMKDAMSSDYNHLLFVLQTIVNVT